MQASLGLTLHQLGLEPMEFSTTEAHCTCRNEQGPASADWIVTEFSQLSQPLFQRLLDHIHIGRQVDGLVGQPRLNAFQLAHVVRHLELGEFESVGCGDDNHPVI